MPLGVQYEFHLIFMGTMIKTEFPSLYDAIISKNLDSDDEEEIYDPNTRDKKKGPKINVRKSKW